MRLCSAIPTRSLRTISAGLCVAGLLATLAPCATAQHGPKPRKENKRQDSHQIEGLETQWRDAMVKGDAGELDKLLADDFLGISANGTLSNKQQYLDRLQARSNRFNVIDLMDQKVRIHPGTVIVTSQARVTGQLDGKPIDGIFRYTKVYRRGQSGGWQVSNFEATRVSGPRQDDTEMKGGTPLRSSLQRPIQQ